MMQVGLASSNFNATISPSGIGTPNVSAGTLAGGVQVGRTWQWTVTRTGDTSNWNQGLQIQVGGQGGTYQLHADKRVPVQPA